MPQNYHSYNFFLLNNLQLVYTQRNVKIIYNCVDYQTVKLYLQTNRIHNANSYNLMRSIFKMT